MQRRVVGESRVHECLDGVCIVSGEAARLAGETRL